jgi:hypothetical protein
MHVVVIIVAVLVLVISVLMGIASWGGDGPPDGGAGSNWQD